MKYIINFIKNILAKEPIKLVGRWRLEKCNIQLGRKIDLSNIDNCGQHDLEKCSFQLKQ